MNPAKTTTSNKWAQKLAAVLLAPLFVLLFVINNGQAQDKTEQAAEQQTTAAASAEPTAQVIYAKALQGRDIEFEKRVKDKLKKQHKGNFEIVADFVMQKVDSSDFIRGGIRYKEVPNTIDKIERQAKKVAEIMVLELVDMGINPGKEGLFVVCTTYSEEKGITGKSLIRAFGRAIYSPDIDSIDWKPAN